MQVGWKGGGRQQDVERERELAESCLLQKARLRCVDKFVTVAGWNCAETGWQADNGEVAVGGQLEDVLQVCKRHPGWTFTTEEESALNKGSSSGGCALGDQRTIQYNQLRPEHTKSNVPTQHC